MKFHYFKELGSTNEYLADMAVDGAEDWTVVIADRQTAGRGRNRRHWWSPPGNLYMSVLVRLKLNPQQMLRLPVVASLAFVSAMGDSGVPLKIKWPNDVLLHGKKVAGILVETRSDSGDIRWAVVGFGVNMNRNGQRIPGELESRIAFVQDLNEDLTREDLAQGIVRELTKWSAALTGERWEEAMGEWTARALLNAPYLFREGDKELRGIPTRLDDSGGLVMRTEEGEVTIYSGEIRESIQDSRFKI